MIEIRKKLCASVLALALGEFTGVSCVDNSGNKTYPRDAASLDEAADSPAGSDTPEGDAAAGDTAGSDAGTPSDTGIDRAGDTAPDAEAGDARGPDVRLDVAAAG